MVYIHQYFILKVTIRWQFQGYYVALQINISSSYTMDYYLNTKFLFMRKIGEAGHEIWIFISPKSPSFKSFLRVFANRKKRDGILVIRLVGSYCKHYVEIVQLIDESKNQESIWVPGRLHGLYGLRPPLPFIPFHTFIQPQDRYPKIYLSPDWWLYEWSFKQYPLLATSSGGRVQVTGCFEWLRSRSKIWSFM